uniref:ATP synthase mitochondrial F1 complex assembly factor 2 n=1 Tax=Acrobeloides nanus TaxID=290746 RepID=A0A914C8N7_9BILA
MKRILFNFVSIRSHSVYTKPKRFYKEVSVADEKDENGKLLYNVMLDKYKLKTQGGKFLKLESEPLALAIAQEWDSQKEHIHQSRMLLTGLAFTSIDNPLRLTKESITSQILEYLDTDSWLYFSTEPENLTKLQEKRWLPLIEWINQKHMLNLKPSYSIVDTPEISEESRKSLQRFLLSYNFMALNGFQYGVEAAKSVLLMLATTAFRISVDEAAELARLEQIYQAKIYGNVEWYHDIEHEALRSRIAASVLFVHLSSNLHTVQDLPRT